MSFAGTCSCQYFYCLFYSVGAPQDLVLHSIGLSHETLHFLLCHITFVRDLYIGLFVTGTFPCLPRSGISSRLGIRFSLISVLDMAYRRQLSCHSVSSRLSTASAASLLSSRKPSSMFTLTGCLSLLEKSPSSAAASASSSHSIFNTSSLGKCGIEFGVSFGLWLWLTSCVLAMVVITVPIFSRQARTASTVCNDPSACSPTETLLRLLLFGPFSATLGLQQADRYPSVQLRGQRGFFLFPCLFYANPSF